MDKLQLISDLHLENGLIEIEPLRPYLVIAGDVAPYHHPFYLPQMEYFSRHWEYVFYVLGNHEYYGEGLQAEEEIKRLLSALPNVIILNRKVVEIEPAIYLLGCTLWSYLPPSLDLRNLNELKKIPFLTVEKRNRLFLRDYHWLRTAVENLHGKILVVTHHAPFLRNHPDHEEDPLSYGYGTNIDVSGIDLWMYGHTHYNLRKGIFFANCYRNDNHDSSVVPKSPHEKTLLFDSEEDSRSYSSRGRSSLFSNRDSQP